ncbi:MAG: hypothetical protein IKC50_07160 [Oscillospiraceae bacterium]|nr:hypothetical protein [Oscillospiraceae bacterium]MBR2978030.1 hypothetical protein [Oscillospiraceae bacterium]
MEKKAFFVLHPRRLEDLRVPHFAEQERAYRIVARVCLPKIDYENFVCDMLADRSFLENRGRECKTGTVWECLLVRQRGRRGGVLVIPERRGFVGWAAYAAKRSAAR